MDKHFFEFLLRMGDTTLILSQRLGEWTGHGPILEEDLALTNTALDLLGQARMWLTLAGEVEGAGRDEDALAICATRTSSTTRCWSSAPTATTPTPWRASSCLTSGTTSCCRSLSGPPTNASRRSPPRRSRKSPITCAVRRTWWCVWRRHGRKPRQMQAAIDDAWRFTGELFFDDAVDQDPRARHRLSVVRVARALGPPRPRCWARPRCPCRTPQPPAIRPSRRPPGRHSEELGYVPPRCTPAARLSGSQVDAMPPVSAGQVFDWLQEVPDPEIPVLSVVDWAWCATCAGTARPAWS